MSDEQIIHQLEILNVCRRTLFFLIQQQDSQGGAFQALPQVVFSVSKTKNHIQRITSKLQELGVSYEEILEGEDPNKIPVLEKSTPIPIVLRSDEGINRLKEDLAARREKLQTLLLQEAMFGGSTYLPPGVLHDIHSERQEILTLKNTLRSMGLQITDISYENPSFLTSPSFTEKPDEDTIPFFEELLKIYRNTFRHYILQQEELENPTYMSSGITECVRESGQCILILKALLHAWRVHVLDTPEDGKISRVLESLNNTWIGNQQLIGNPIQFYSCFLSHSDYDREFAQCLYRRLRGVQLRTWYSPKDTQGGKKLSEQIDQAIRMYDKLLVVLSGQSLLSKSVQDELRNARKAELRDNKRKLFPIRLVDLDILNTWKCIDPDTGEDLAVEIREYYIPDFTNWKDDAAFERAFQRLLHDLQTTDTATLSSSSTLQEFHMNTISILFVSADPTNASRLRLGEEFREIQEKLRLAKRRDRFKLELPQLSVRPADIAQVLLDVEPQIVHFSGHGSSTGALCFENQIGETHPVQPDALAALFEQFDHQVNCVLLNACYSEIQAKAIAKYIKYVIGMNRAIGDKAAIAFAIGFYQALGAGRTIEDAYELGCVQIRLQGIPEHLTPVLIKKE